jgi:hypothetical protein
LSLSFAVPRESETRSVARRPRFAALPLPSALATFLPGLSRTMARLVAASHVADALASVVLGSFSLRFALPPTVSLTAPLSSAVQRTTTGRPSLRNAATVVRCGRSSARNAAASGAVPGSGRVSSGSGPLPGGGGGGGGGGTGRALAGLAAGCHAGLMYWRASPTFVICLTVSEPVVLAITRSAFPFSVCCQITLVPSGAQVGASSSAKLPVSGVATLVPRLKIWTSGSPAPDPRRCV